MSSREDVMNGNGVSTIRVLQISNISPSATKEQIQTLFSFVGRIEDIRTPKLSANSCCGSRHVDAIYPNEGVQAQQRFAYVKFDRPAAVELGQHLTNVVFIDLALVCVPAPSNTIPDEETALRSGPALPGQRQLPPNVVSSTQVDADGQEMLYTVDPTMTALGVAQYPPLPANTEPSKVEEIRRTVYIGGLKKDTDGEELMKFLNATIGEVMYLRMTAGNEYLPCLYAYVEFSNQASVPLALQNNGIEFNNAPLKIHHSRVAIIKPKQKTADQAMEEVEAAIRHNEGRTDSSSVALSRGYSPASNRSGSKRRSVTPPVRRRSPARWSRDRSSPPRRSRDRDRSPRRYRSPSPARRRSRDRESKSSKRSRDRKRSRSRTPKKEKSRKRYSRSPSPKKSKKRDKNRDRNDDDMMLREEEELRRRLKEKMISN
ncbi:hypothetical protein M3Y95_00613500 [Aphelenchoides besseyi]|nr:hypothetical protein M3Y95_00613500 [Aphelenchoides besseyi]